MSEEQILMYDYETGEYYYEEECCGCRERCCKPCCDPCCEPCDPCEEDPCDPPCEDWCEFCKGECCEHVDSIESNCGCKKKKCKSSNCNSRSNRRNRQNNNRRNRTRSGATNSEDNEEVTGAINGIQGWLKNPTGTILTGDTISFNALKGNSQNGPLSFDSQSNEFVVNQSGSYVLRWNLNAAPTIRNGEVYITFTKNNEDKREVLSGVRNVFRGVNGSPNIVNSSYLVFSANEGDRFSLNNESDGPINIVFLDSAIGGRISILRIQKE